MNDNNGLALVAPRVTPASYHCLWLALVDGVAAQGAQARGHPARRGRDDPAERARHRLAPIVRHAAGERRRQREREVQTESLCRREQHTVADVGRVARLVRPQAVGPLRADDRLCSGSAQGLPESGFAENASASWQPAIATEC